MQATADAPSLKTIFLVYFGLLGLFALAVGAGFLPASHWKLPLGLLIAAAKMLVIFLFFMRLRYQKGIIRIFAFAAFFWLGIIGTLTFADYLTRDWLF